MWLVAILAAAAAPAYSGVQAGDIADVRGVPLEQAVARGWVRASLTGTGGASGASVRLHVQRTAKAGPGELRVRVPLGTYLHNASGAEQDMVVLGLLGEVAGPSSYSPADVIELRDNRPHEYVLEAYCAQAHKENPSSGRSFSLGRSASSELHAVLRAADRVPKAHDDIMVMQATVWTVTDNISRGELASIGYSLTAAQLQTVRSVLVAAGRDPKRYRLFQGR